MVLFLLVVVFVGKWVWIPFCYRPVLLPGLGLPSKTIPLSQACLSFRSEIISHRQNSAPCGLNRGTEIWCQIGQKRGSETKRRNFRKGKIALDFGLFWFCFSFLFSSRIREGLWNKRICPLRNQSQTQEVGGRSLPRCPSCRVPSVRCGRSSCMGPSCWETRREPVSPVTSISSPMVGEREAEIPLTEHMRMWQVSWPCLCHRKEKDDKKAGVVHSLIGVIWIFLRDRDG